MSKPSADLNGIIKALEEEATISDPILAPEFHSFENPSANLIEHGKWQDLKIHVEVILGTTKLRFDKLTSLKEGSIIVFEELADEFVDIFINGQKIAKGKIATVDGNYAIQIVQILDKKERIQRLY